MAFSIGTDTGGTFTDTVVIDDQGAISIGKQPSTPPEFVQGVVDSIQDAASRAGVDDLLDQTSSFHYGTTIVVNAITTGRVGRAGLIVTRGFASTLSIARATSRTNGFSSEEMHRYAERRKPRALVPPSRRLIVEVPERIDVNGSVLAPLDEDAARDAIRSLVEQDVDAIAVCLLWSFRNDVHEQRILQLCEENAPGVRVSLSSELVPKIGEYERMATVAYNAATIPVATEHLLGLNKTLEERGLEPGRTWVMQGNGGLDTSAQVQTRPVNLLGSGPAGGVLGAKLLADAIGLSDVICTDVGGTTFDVGLIVDGQPLLTPTAIARQHRLYLPIVDVVSIGAGGGSIAQVDPVSGHLTVGPDSAGASPGPVCYGGGGDRATVTDADLVLGVIDPDFFLGGGLRLDLEAAREAIQGQIADPLGMTIEQAAAAMVEVADNHMADLIRQLTVERGYDPRSFTTFLYGGGGPLHGTSYATKLRTKGMIVPGGALASVFSAWGIAGADVHHTHEVSSPQVAPFSPESIASVFADLEDQAMRRFDADGIPPEMRVIQRVGELRYRTQTNEVAVNVPDGPIDEAMVEQVAAAFDQRYAELFGEGSGFQQAGVEWINFRVQAYGRRERPQLPTLPAGPPVPEAHRVRDVYWYESSRREATKIYRDTNLGSGSRLVGPAIVELPTTTVVVRPGQELVVDDFGNYLINES